MSHWFSLVVNKTKADCAELLSMVMHALLLFITQRVN